MGRVTLLDTIMSEEHEQHDMVWQPGRVGAGRRVMKRGILAYRAAYPDLKFEVLHAACCDTPAQHASPAASLQHQQDSGSSEQGSAGPSVFVRWHATGTNLGPVREQPPTGNKVSFAGISQLCFDVEGEKMAVHCLHLT